jgi:hypothetical protein
MCKKRFTLGRISHRGEYYMTQRSSILTILILAVTLLVTACTSGGFGPFTRFDSNGERVYFTGTSSNGSINYSGGDFSPMTGRG